jgi:hypothetical protein
VQSAGPNGSAEQSELSDPTVAQIANAVGRFPVVREPRPTNYVQAVHFLLGSCR